MRLHLINILLCVATSGLTFLSGCDKDSADPELKVQFENYDFEWQRIWVVVQSAEGSEVLAVREVSSNGIIEFDEDLPDGVTLTIAYQYASQQFYVTSYVNVSKQLWRREFNSFPQSYGEIRFTLQYPEGEFSRLTAWVPGHAITTSEISPRSHSFSEISVYRPFGSEIDIAGLIEGEEANFIGWQRNVPFVPYALNTYTLQLDQPTTRIPVHLTIPVNGLSLTGYVPWDYMSSFRVQAVSDSVARADREFRVPDIEFSGYWISVWSEQPNFFSYGKEYDALPSTIEVPEKSISFEYDDVNGVYGSISVQGGADAISGNWVFQNSDVYGAWTVYCSANSSTIAKPMLPDSLADLLSITDRSLNPAHLYLYDVNPGEGWNSYVLRLAGSGRAPEEEESYYQYIEIEPEVNSPAKKLLREQLCREAPTEKRE